MNTIAPTPFERVQYEMFNPTLGSILIMEPEGWKDDEKEYARNEEYHGIVAKFSNNLAFLGDAADFINMVFDLEDAIGQIKLTKRERHPHTDQWHKTYWGYLDLFTKEDEGNKVKVKFNSGGLEQDLKARENESVEIDRETSINGMVIPPLQTQSVALDGRRIFLKSKWDVEQPAETVMLHVNSDDGNTRGQVKGFPLSLSSRSHEEAQTVLLDAQSDDVNGDLGVAFFAYADRQKTVTVIGKDIKFKPKVKEVLFFGIPILQNGWDWVDFRLSLTHYDGDFNIKSRTNLFYRYGGDGNDTPIYSMHNVLQAIADFQQTFVLLKNDCLALEFVLISDIAGNNTVAFDVNNIEGTIYVEEDSVFQPSQCKFLLIHELADRLATICTNKFGVFKSDFFGRTDIGYLQNGPGAFNGLTHGFWIRQFDKLPIGDENKFKPLTTSWKEMIESLNPIHNVSVGIETINNKEVIKIEELGYFYQPTVTIRLANQVSKVKRTVANNYYFGSINIGYDKGAEYEEAQGLDEYNGKSTFTTIMNVKNIFTKLSKWRADSYGIEFARRKPFVDYSTTDTSYDSDNFILDLKKGPTAIYEQRKWQDDFDVAPTGIFSPDTATNLRLSPLNMLLRHGWFIASCLLKYPYEKIRYGSSTANSALNTKLRTDAPYVADSNNTPGNVHDYTENGDIVNSELKKAHFIPQYIEFEYECDFFIMQQIEGFRVVNGKRLPNFYGMVEFTNEKGEIERGYLVTLKPNKNGQWKLIKANI